MLQSSHRSMARQTALAVSALALLAGSASAYVPATPSNDTSSLVAADDFIQINWLPQGTTAFKDALSRQLAFTQGQPVAGYRGALTHFADNNATASTNTPWIALISCDDTSSNSPFGSQLDSVSLALRAGAETAILYSLYSETCVLQPNFVAAANGSVDLYVTASKQSAQAINNQFTNVDALANWFNSTALSDSNAVVQSQISNLGGAPSTSTVPSLFGPTTSSSAPAAGPTGVENLPAGAFSYLIATVANSNTTGSGAPITTQQQNPNAGSGANTGLAMIILYAITGCVTLLFLIVIMSGAIRAMRHPERYGPRARTSRPGDNGRSRIGGLSQAILDTFPVVKFLSGQKQGATAPDGQSQNNDERDNAQKDLESGETEHNENAGGNNDRNTTAAVPMHLLSNGRTSTSSEQVGASAGQDIQPVEGAAAVTGLAAATTTETRPSTDSNTQHASTAVDTDPNAVDDSQTCPICLLDFEDGDDIRILPCDSRHRFHDACVVPWLLNVSSLCPLCRLDLAKDRDVPDQTEAGEGENAQADATARPTVRPRASSVLATSIRQLLPSSTNPSRLSRQGNSAADASTTGAAATAGISELGEMPAQQGDAGQQPTRSRFMRYVEQRRQRVRPRSYSRRDTTASVSAHVEPRTDA